MDKGILLFHFSGHLGKCFLCGHIDEVRRRSYQEGIIYKQCADELHMLHRTHYNQCREAVAANKADAIMNPEEVCCVDIDIASQSVYSIPHESLQNSLGKTIQSHFVGALEVNKGVTLFHYYDSIKKVPSILSILSTYLTHSYTFQLSLPVNM